MHQATLNIRSKSQWEMRAQKPTVIMMKKFFGSFEVIRLRKTFPVFSQHPVGYHAGKQIESAIYCFNIFVFMNVLVFSSNTRVTCKHTRVSGTSRWRHCKEQSRILNKNVVSKNKRTKKQLHNISTYDIICLTSGHFISLSTVINQSTTRKLIKSGFFRKWSE